MKGTSHIIAGAVTGIAVSQNFNIPITAAIGFSVLGSVIVDIDEEHSTINKVLTLGMTKHRNIVKGIIGAAMVIYPMTLLRYMGAVLLLSIISSKHELRFSLWSGPELRKYHRTCFHDPVVGLVLFIIPMLILKLPGTFFLPYIIGVILHYVLDSFTSYGLPLILIKNKSIRMPIIHYQSNNMIAEYIILVLYIVTLYYFKFISLNNILNL